MTTRTEIRLTDLVREVGGWPINLEAVCDLLDTADDILPNGRDNTNPLTDEQIKALGFE